MDRANEVAETQWTMETGVDVNVHPSDMTERHVGISFIGNETCFSIDITVDDALSLRDELSRLITDVFRLDRSIRCPACGYTWDDAKIHADHRNCRRFPFFPDESGQSHAINKV